MAATVFAGCGSSSKKSSGTTSGTSAGSSSGSGITIEGFAFHPDSLSVAAGSTVKITNKDGTEHTVTADDGSFSVDVPGANAEIKAPTKPGTYGYHCNIHTTMKATLVVT